MLGEDGFEEQLEGHRPGGWSLRLRIEGIMLDLALLSQLLLLSAIKRHQDRFRFCIELSIPTS